MQRLPHVVKAEYCGSHRLRLVFNEGLANTLDFAPWLVGPVFEPLKDTAYFARFFLDGGPVCWPNGAGIAPETLYDAGADDVPTGRPASAAGGQMS